MPKIKWKYSNFFIRLVLQQGGKEKSQKGRKGEKCFVWFRQKGQDFPLQFFLKTKQTVNKTVNTWSVHSVKTEVFELFVQVKVASIELFTVKII